MALSNPRTCLILPSTSDTARCGRTIVPFLWGRAKNDLTMLKAFTTESVANWEMNREILLFAA